MTSGDPARLVVVSDSHLSPRMPPATANWRAAVDDLPHQGGADLAVHLGDLTLDGASHPDELAVAAAELGRLSTPWRAVPGNHDVGENPGHGRPEWCTDPGRREAWLDLVGPDHWRFDVGSWTVLGLDSQLLGTGWPAEDEQWAWLDDQLGAVAGRPVILALHKPLASTEEGRERNPSRFVPPGSAGVLEAVLRRTEVRLVVSGHVHQHLEADHHGAHHVWAPSTWAVLPDDVQPAVGRKVCGTVRLELFPDGSFRADLVRPPGVEQLTIGLDTPDPYGLGGGSHGPH